MSLTIVVGDIHGMADKLTRLLSEIDAWLISKGHKTLAQFIFLGDYINRGPDSKVSLRRGPPFQIASFGRF
jgi:predicted phosphodiesterase